MNKNIKAILACTGVLVIAGGGYAALMLTDKAPDTSASLSDEPIATMPAPILENEKADIVSVTAENAEGGFEAVTNGKTDDEGTPELEVKGLDGLKQNNTVLLSLLNACSALSCDGVVAEGEKDLDKYGLKTPQATVKIKLKNGEKTLLIGNESPQSGETYCMVEGGGTVYLSGTSAVSVFLNRKENFLDLALIPTNEDGSKPTAENVKIQREDLDYDINLTLDATESTTGNKVGTMATHVMTEPINCYLDAEKSTPAVQSFFGMNAYSAVTAHPTDEEKKAMQLDKPFCTVEMNVQNGDSYTIKIGKALDIAEGKYRAVMLNDIDIVYAVSEEDLCWATLKPDDIISRMIFGTYVWDVGTLKIDVKDGESVEFIGSGKDENDYKLTKNGKSASAVRFKQFYQFLLKASAEEFDITDKPEGEPDLSILLETQDKSVTQTVEFYQADGKKSYIVVNGVPCFKCRTAYVQLLKENLAKFDSSEEFVTNW